MVWIGRLGALLYQGELALNQQFRTLHGALTYIAVTLFVVSSCGTSGRALAPSTAPDATLTQSATVVSSSTLLLPATSSAGPAASSGGCPRVSLVDQSKFQRLNVGRLTFAPWTLIQLNAALGALWPRGICSGTLGEPEFVSEVCADYRSSTVFMQACGDVPIQHVGDPEAGLGVSLRGASEGSNLLTVAIDEAALAASFAITNNPTDAARLTDWRGTLGKPDCGAVLDGLTISITVTATSARLEYRNCL